MFYAKSIPESDGIIDPSELAPIEHRVLDSALYESIHQIVEYLIKIGDIQVVDGKFEHHIEPELSWSTPAQVTYVEGTVSVNEHKDIESVYVDRYTIDGMYFIDGHDETIVSIVATCNNEDEVVSAFREVHE